MLCCQPVASFLKPRSCGRYQCGHSMPHPTMPCPIHTVASSSSIGVQKSLPIPPTVIKTGTRSMQPVRSVPLPWHQACPIHTVACPTHNIPCPTHTVACPTHNIPCPIHTVAYPTHNIPCPTHTVACPTHTVACPTHGWSGGLSRAFIPMGGQVGYAGPKDSLRRSLAWQGCRHPLSWRCRSGVARLDMPYYLLQI